jgi:hypothetical protein
MLRIFMSISLFAFVCQQKTILHATTPFEDPCIVRVSVTLAYHVSRAQLELGW